MKIRGTLICNALMNDFIAQELRSTYSWKAIPEDDKGYPVIYEIPDEIITDVYENEVGRTVYVFDGTDQRLDTELFERSARYGDHPQGPLGCGRPLIIYEGKDGKAHLIRPKVTFIETMTKGKEENE